MSDLLRELMEELVLLLKEAIERKTDAIRKRRKKDLMRVQLAHIFERMAENKTFAQRYEGCFSMGLRQCLKFTISLNCYISIYREDRGTNPIIQVLHILLAY